MGLSSAAVLQMRGDVVSLTLPGKDGPIYVLQLGDADQNIVVRQGGELVFAFLDLCDGTRTLFEIREELFKRYAGPETLWNRDLREAVDSLLAWRVIEEVES